ncbi:MAG: DUF4437 domain-containing protein [Bdellovibrionales bacterium]|nr:DUF4437 domain-containing protein [Bdellovibrionales bacterium]
MKIFLVALTCFISLAQAADKPITRTMNDKNIKWGPCPEIFPQGCQLGLLHGSPEKKNTDVFLKLPPNYNLPAHTHTSAEHMTMVSGNLEVQFKDEKKIVLTPGTYAFGPAEHAHQAKCTSKDSCVLFISFDEPIDAKAYTGTI